MLSVSWFEPVATAFACSDTSLTAPVSWSAYTEHDAAVAASSFATEVSTRSRSRVFEASAQLSTYPVPNWSIVTSACACPRVACAVTVAVKGKVWLPDGTAASAARTAAANASPCFAAVVVFNFRAAAFSNTMCAAWSATITHDGAFSSTSYTSSRCSAANLASWRTRRRSVAIVGVRPRAAEECLGLPFGTDGAKREPNGLNKICFRCNRGAPGFVPGQCRHSQPQQDDDHDARHAAADRAENRVSTSRHRAGFKVAEPW